MSTQYYDSVEYNMFTGIVKIANKEVETNIIDGIFSKRMRKDDTLIVTVTSRDSSASCIIRVSPDGNITKDTVGDSSNARGGRSLKPQIHLGS